MPDEVVFTAGAKSTPPAGTKIATDTVGGKEIQFVKLDLGGDGIASPVSDAIPVYDISGTTVNVNVTVSGTSIQYVTGTVSVQNFPPIQDVAIVSGTIAVTVTPPIQQGISGSVSIDNWPIQQGISGTVFVGNFPSVQDVAIVSGTLIIAGSDMVEVSGTVSIANFPTMQGISGTVFVGNFPATQQVAIVSGSASFNAPVMQGVSGTVHVDNLPPVSQGISGTVAVSNFPIQQGISGTVHIDNSWITVSGSVGKTKISLTPYGPTGTSVGVNPSLIVPANSARTGLVLVNTSAAWISLGLGTSGTIYNGISLTPNGGTYVMDDYTFCRTAIYAIASKNNSTIAVQEFS